MNVIKNIFSKIFDSKTVIVVPGNSPLEGTTDLLIETTKYTFTDVLDIGLGQGGGSLFFLSNKKKVTALGYDVDSYKVPDVIKEQAIVHENVSVENMGIFQEGSFDAVWCSHVIEHCFNTGLALQEIRRVLSEDGVLFLSVPPFKHNVVGGHINVGWNIGILMYVLCLNGFDVVNGSFVQHGYNITAFVKPRYQELPPLRFDEGDIERLVTAGLLPDFFCQNIDGSSIQNYQWNWLDRNQVEIRYV